jgi:cytochrome c5
MKRLVIIATLLSGCGRAPEAAQPVAADTVVRISLPDDPAAPWTSPVIERNCVACHSSEMIANQPPLGPDKWQATIDKMRTVYAAKIDPADDAALVAALQATQTP